VTVTALCSTSAFLNVGAVWHVSVLTRDADGYAVDDDPPVVTVTLPDASTVPVAAENISTGVWRALYVPATAGRFLAAAVTTALGRADFAAIVTGVASNASLPTFEDVRAYSGSEYDLAAWEDETITETLATETLNQARMCDVPAAYPDDLREALVRRAVLNLARRRHLVDDGATGDDTMIPPPPPPSRDPEVRRLEGPHRRLVMG
jgi:hypothetical protein